VAFPCFVGRWVGLCGKTEGRLRDVTPTLKRISASWGRKRGKRVKRRTGPRNSKGWVNFREFQLWRAGAGGREAEHHIGTLPVGGREGWGREGRGRLGGRLSPVPRKNEHFFKRDRRRERAQKAITFLDKRDIVRRGLVRGGGEFRAQTARARFGAGQSRRGD